MGDKKESLIAPKRSRTITFSWFTPIRLCLVADGAKVRVFAEVRRASSRRMGDWSTWGCDASSRFAAPALRSVPSDDPPYPHVQYAFHARKETSSRSGQICDIGGDGVVKCYIYS